ncbi:tyrosine-type recombinase/integrase [Streptomyces sp. NPDC020379]|uniref:tyrosine-type recombinase/integrase n=1 Tax=Streptomyces sp. NPDC020379 TaxID=3365071 RepID=UPI00379BEB5E
MTAVTYPDAVKARDEWLESFQGRTREEYGRDVRRYFEHCESRGTNPLDARQAEVDSFRTLLRERGIGASAWNRARAAVKSFYIYVVRETRCERNPVEATRRARTAKRKQLGFTKEEAEQLLDEAYHSGNEKLYVLVLTILETGQRISEIVGADIRDLDYEHGYPVLRTTVKGEETQEITPLNGRVFMALLTMIGGRTSGPLFTTRSGKRMTRQGAYDMLARLARRVLRFRANFRKGRRTFITLALDLGIPLDYVQEAVHHDDPRTTKGYDDGRRALGSSPTYALEKYLVHPDDPAEESLPARPALSVVRDADEVITLRKADLVKLITEEVVLMMRKQPAVFPGELVAA